MPGSSYGTMFRITTWGESHGKGIGVVVDGCPAGLPLCEEDIQTYLNRRKPGQSKYTTARQEDDAVEILSGVFDGKTTGTPISMISRRRPVFRPGDNRPGSCRSHRLQDIKRTGNYGNYLHQIHRRDLLHA